MEYLITVLVIAAAYLISKLIGSILTKGFVHDDPLFNFIIVPTLGFMTIGLAIAIFSLVHFMLFA